jgi:hypothetical protein
MKLKTTDPLDRNVMFWVHRRLPMYKCGGIILYLLDVFILWAKINLTGMKGGCHSLANVQLVEHRGGFIHDVILSLHTTEHWKKSFLLTLSHINHTNQQTTHHRRPHPI